MKTAISDLDLRRASSLDEALLILRDEPRMPVAGATDVYVAVNFGTLAPKRFSTSGAWMSCAEFRCAEKR